MSFSDPHFAEPKWLWLAILGPLLLFALQRYSAIARRRQLERLANASRVADLTFSHSSTRRLIKDVLLLLSVAGIGIALARPQWGQQADTTQILGEDVVFVLDCSKSMLATDVTPNRLQRSKYAIQDYVQSRSRGRVGLVAFAGQAFLQCPLTFDHQAFLDALAVVDERTIPVGGTDIGRALDEGFRAMEKGAQRKLLILVTDGEDLEKGAVKTAEKLEKEGVVVYALGVGTPSGSEITLVSEVGQVSLLYDAQGQVVKSRLDEATLTQIGQATRGAYFPLGAAGEGLAKVRVELDSTASDRGSRGGKSSGVDRFHVPVALVLLLLAGEPLLGTRRRMRHGKSRMMFGGRDLKKEGTAVAFAVLILSLGHSGMAAPKDVPEVVPETPREFFNAGTRMLAKGNLKEAEGMLESAVASQKEQLQSPGLYNLGHARFLQGLQELKKGPSSSTALQGSRSTLGITDQVIDTADEALRSRVVSRMVEAYMRGRGARRELKAAKEAVEKALAAHSATLQKWERAAGDFGGAFELNPALKQAKENEDITNRHIASLVDSLRELQQMASALGKSKEELKQKMKQLKGQIPQPDMPPGADGDEEEDEEERKDGPQEGEKESQQKGEEMKLTPEQAAWLLEGYRLDSERRLPMGVNNQAEPKDKNRRDW